VTSKTSDSSSIDRLSHLEELGLGGPATDRTRPGSHAGTWLGTGAELVSRDPASGQVIGKILQASDTEYEEIVLRAREAFEEWRRVPAPKRGEWAKRLGEKLVQHKRALGRLVSLECGKILSEGEGEVQEMIDMADFAVGLSRQLYGLSMHSERPDHRMFEQWHPIGPVGVVTAFNFPVAVWAWNALVAGVCGNTIIWKPSEKTPLCAVAVQHLVNEVTEELGLPQISFLACGGLEIGEAMARDARLPLISATGSCRMGREVAPVVARRMGRCLLELGGNNGMIVLDDSDVELSLRAVVFSAVGTAGQRCTTLRRCLIQKGIANDFTARLMKIYQSLPERVGDPLDECTLVGPLVDEDAVLRFEASMKAIREQGGEVLCGGHRVPAEKLPDNLASGSFVEPTLVRARADMPIVREETFAPILYLITVDDLDEAISLHNDVDQGLSSAIFTNSIRSSERFLSSAGSDCGIANVNIGTSGAEIGGAFGGEKDTGGGREAGSDAWKAYMRRQTCTVNWGTELPLAQGVEFDV
jgi:aldehyde dehydrogenase (NAD+)